MKTRIRLRTFHVTRAPGVILGTVQGPKDAVVLLRKFGLGPGREIRLLVTRRDRRWEPAQSAAPRLAHRAWDALRSQRASRPAVVAPHARRASPWHGPLTVR